MNATPAKQLERRPAPELPFYDPVLEEFAALNTLIPSRLTSDVDMVEEIGTYIVESGGKRLRPLVVLLAATACGARGDDRMKLAAIIEFLHTATLLHDDVVDHSVLRRGRRTANDLWGNAPSVLVGDFLYSRAFQMMVELADMEIMAVLSRATNVIAEGEVMQLANIGRLDLDEARYMEVIRCKTAMLFEAASHTVAILAGADAGRVDDLAAYGRELGLCFQLVDDALDYAGHTERLGKNVGDDLAEGKLTLPLIHTLATGSAAQVKVVRSAVEARDGARFDEVRDAVEAAGAIEYTRERAVACADAARCRVEKLPAGPHRDALVSLTAFAVARDH
ncbi:MAG: polyprenyl synthetase family protein [Pseudomonadales bacterium]|jgi:octaprenyl-diphosphate synthase|nr:polyprenyl synthetase family protein [Pseudomonadales bacterium]